MTENDRQEKSDPLWYDRAEPDLPPGLGLTVAAYLLLLLMAGVRLAISVYWLPDALWCRTLRYIQRRRTARS